MAEPRRDKTESCMWCGGSEALGFKLKEKTPCLAGRSRFVCADNAACEKRIKTALIVGPA